MPFRPSPETRRQIDWLGQRFGTDQTVITLAVDRLYCHERRTVNDNLFDMAAAVYTEVFGHLDDKRFKTAKMSEIADWLSDGDGGVGRTVTALAAEWREYDAEDVAANPE